jgi:hypothetical protein
LEPERFEERNCLLVHGSLVVLSGELIGFYEMERRMLEKIRSRDGKGYKDERGQQ